MMLLPSDPPGLNELEVTLFGPGYGESIVIHADGDWLIVDSCINPVTKRPVALDYLAGLAVVPEAVKLVACTHWHDDHCRGLSQLFQAFSSARLCLSAALKSDEFLGLMAGYQGWTEESSTISSGVEEIQKVIEIAQQRNCFPQFALGDRRIWQSSTGVAELFSLSPSDGMLTRAYAQLAVMMPTTWTEKRRASVGSPNHVSVAMHLKAGSHAVLLGSDLEEQGDPATGWSAVVASQSRPRSTAALYKVAHHGSPTGEHPGLWTQLVSSPVSIITPFSRGRSPLPSVGDRSRLKVTSKAVHLTADQKVRTVKRTGALAKMTRSKKMQLVQTTFGAVRCRIDATVESAEWRVEHFGDAVAL